MLGGRPVNPLARALRASAGSLIAVAVFSIAVNLLMLTTPLYMLQVFDRVLTGRSVDTLLFLTLAALLALVTLAVLEGARLHAMAKIGLWLDQSLSEPAYAAALAQEAAPDAPAAQAPLRDIAQIRHFLTGPGLFPLMDAPWIPIFVAALYLLHPHLAALAVAGAVILLVIALANELATRRLQARVASVQAGALQEAEAARANADAISAMALLPGLLSRWRASNRRVLDAHERASAVTALARGLTRFVRYALQVGVLAVGAFLVLKAELTAGGMIAASILATRALAPVDQAIAGWRATILARDAWRRASEALQSADPIPVAADRLPAPTGALALEDVSYVPPGGSDPLIRKVSLALPPGGSMAIIGPSASGKSTMARMIAGTLQPRLGAVRLDNVDLFLWPDDDRGRHIGYVPQSVELFPATVRDNIARMSEAPLEAVIAAAQAARAHDLILRLPQGYDTPVSGGIGGLSGGERQRIALARALFGAPRLVILDEPAAHLDQEGEEALLACLGDLRDRGMTLVLVAHRPNLLRAVDSVLLLQPAGGHRFGPRDEILALVTRQRDAPNRSAGSVTPIKPAQAPNG